jgi:type I restriction-modification system DNA methylase subunit
MTKRTSKPIASTQDLYKQLERFTAVHRKSAGRIENVIEDLVDFTLLGCAENILAQYPQGRLFSDIKHKLGRYDGNQQAINDLLAMGDSYLKLIAINPPFTDCITEMLAEHCNEQLGQYLTPPDVAKLLAHFHDYELLQRRARQGLACTIGDITGCGAGSLLLSLLSHIYEYYPEVIPYVLVEGIDLDPVMTKIAFTQIVLSGCMHRTPPLGVHIINGNAITESRDGITAFIQNLPGFKAIVSTRGMPLATEAITPEMEAVISQIFGTMSVLDEGEVVN